jgi:glutamine synthetase
MCGSSASISRPEFILNTIIAEQFKIIADRLDKLPDNCIPEKRTQEINNIINEVIKNHKRIIFNGNNYSEEWHEIAKSRGLGNPQSSIDSFDAIIQPDIITMFERHGVLSKNECNSRCEVVYDTYVKTLQIETDTLQIMINREILPSVLEYISELSTSAINLSSLNIDNSLQTDLIKSIQDKAVKLKKLLIHLEESTVEIKELDDLKEQARKYRDIILPLFEEIRLICDSLETIMPEKKWALPTYADLMFRL